MDAVEHCSRVNAPEEEGGVATDPPTDPQVDVFCVSVRHRWTNPLLDFFKMNKVSIVIITIVRACYNHVCNVHVVDM